MRIEVANVTLAVSPPPIVLLCASTCVSPGATKSLTSMCDRLALDASERDDRHGALLDADMTADALILLEHLLKHGESVAPRSWTSA